MVTASTGRRTVTSKLAAIIDVFGSGDVHSLSEIACRADLPVSTAHRLAQELTVWGLLERVPERGYRVGAALRAIGGHWRHDPGLYGKGRRIVTDLAAATRLTARFGVMVGPEIRFMEKGPDRQPPPTRLEAAGLPAHATAMGKSLLAFAPPQVVDAVAGEVLPAYTPFTIGTGSQLRKELAAVRIGGVATSHQELRIGASAVGVPVFAAGGVAVAALEVSVDGSASQMAVARAALLIAARSMGYELCAAAGSADRPLAVPARAG